MPKNTLLLCAFVILFSCGKSDDDSVSCTQLAQESLSAVATFNTNPTIANCQAAKTALEAQRDECDVDVAESLAELTQC